MQLSITSRILTPVDFGIYAIALFFSGLGRIAFSMGLGPALVQKKRRC
ncbi:oligosaccharide flippase family protein [Bacteroides thetaiotaomicron]